MAKMTGDQVHTLANRPGQLEKIVTHKSFNSVCNVFIVGIYAWFIYRHANAIFIYDFSIFALLFVILESLIIALVLLRSKPRIRSSEVHAWISTLFGTFLLLLYNPEGEMIQREVGNILVSIGVILVTLSYLSLNTSFGLTPALREVKTTGLYRFVRHPMYFSYLFIIAGYLLWSFSLYNLSISIATLVFQYLRASYEEKILCQDLKYVEYKSKVKWRFIPGVI